MARPYRAKCHGMPKPRAMPWAGMCRTVGAENTHLHATLNAPSHPVRNRLLRLLRLLRLTADSPDLLAVIKAEGKV